VDLGEAAVPELAKVLASPDPDAVMTACRTLGAIRRPAASAAPALLGTITSPVPWVRRSAAEALVQVAPDDPEAKAALTLLLKDEAPDNRACAARLLGMLRRTDSAPTLADAAAADRWARMDCCLALARLGAAGLPHLLRLAAHEDGDVRMWAVRGISSMGPSAKEAVPVMRKALTDSDSSVRESADRALRGLDPGSEGPVDPALLLGRKVRDLLDRAAILSRQQKPAEALALYEEAVRVDPGCAAGWIEIGSIHHRAQRHPEALEAYATALRIEPENPSALYGSGLSLHAAARYEEGLRFLRDAARVRPDHSDTLVVMSYCQYSLGMYEDCAVACRDALRLSPEDADAHQRLGLALVALRRPGEAVPPFRDLVRLKPRYANGHYYLSLALRRSGEPGAAVEEARKALELRPKETDYLAALVGALRDAGRPEEAAAALEDLRRISPEAAAKLE